MDTEQPIYIRSTKAIVVCTLLCLTGYFSAPAQFNPLGVETRVNIRTAGTQQHAAIAAGSAGCTVVAWESQEQDGDGFAVAAIVYDTSGTATVSEFIVNTTTAGDQRFPAVAMADNGHFAVSWMSYGQDGDGWGVYYALYDTAGTIIQGETLAHPETSGQQTFPAIAMAPSGEFVLAWGSNGDIYGRVFDAEGDAVTASFLVQDSTTAAWETYPEVAMGAGGQLVMTWQSTATNGSGTNVYARRFNTAGVPLSAPYLVNTYTTGNQTEPSVAMDTAGRVTIVWSSYAQDGDAYGVYGQRYDRSGIKQGSAFSINTTTAADQLHPAIAVTTAGRAVVSWTSFDQDGDKAGVYARLIDSDGTFEGDEMLINTTTENYQMLSVPAMYDDAALLTIAWQYGAHEEGMTGDGSSYGIYSQRLLAGSGPKAIARSITVRLDSVGTALIAPEDIDGGSTPGAILSIDISDFDCGDIGDNAVVLTATDRFGNTAADTATVTVADEEAPVLRMAAPVVLWPPDGSFTTFNVSESVSAVADNCGSLSPEAVEIVRVSMDEFSFVGRDIVISDDCKSVDLRARRSLFPFANGRVYTITTKVVDANGNTGFGELRVSVPRSLDIASVKGRDRVQIAGCGARGARAVSHSTGYEEKVSDEQVTIYPTLLENNRTIHVAYHLPGGGHIREIGIYTMNGVKVDTFTGDMTSSGTIDLQMDAEHPSGFYIMKVITDRQIQTTRFIIK